MAKPVYNWLIGILSAGEGRFMMFITLILEQIQLSKYDFAEIVES